MQLIKDWFSRVFSDPQIMILAVILLLGFGGIILTGDMLAPVFIAAILAYLLESPVGKMENWGMSRFVASSIVFAVFTWLLLMIIFGMGPMLYRQSVAFASELPQLFSSGRTLLLALPERYPELVSVEQINEVIAGLSGEINNVTQDILGRTLQFGAAFTYVMVVAVLVPFLVFFMLKDKRKMQKWFKRFLPDDYRLAGSVWREVDVQIGNYVRGKAIEILVVGTVSFIAFLLFGLNYALLLGALVGLSVLVPYIGATLVTFPVMAVGFLQWGPGDTLFWLFMTYGIIQVLDGNALVPLLFSEVVDLHPVAIIVAVLFFGGIWGVVGVFFAIPLGTLVNAVINAWPRAKARTY